MKIVIPVFPSSGGTGSKLNVPSSKFKTKTMLKKVAANPASPGPTGSTTWGQLTESGMANTWKNIPPRIAPAESGTKVKFPAGPPSAIHAARRGYRCCHAGSYGALAHPIIQCATKEERIGTTTNPNG